MNRIIYHDVILGRVTTVLTDDIIIFQDKEAVVGTRDHGNILIPVKNIRSIDDIGPEVKEDRSGSLGRRFKDSIIKDLDQLSLLKLALVKEYIKGFSHDAPHAGDLGSEYSADDINMPEGGLP